MKRRDFLAISAVAAPVAAAAATPRPVRVPTWFGTMRERTWTALAGGNRFGARFQNGARIADVAPHPTPPGAEGTSAVLNDWTGGCCSQGEREFYLPAQGGHNGYYGNEVYALRLTDEQPAWRRIWGPTPNELILTSALGANPPAFSHADGNPRATHGWFQVFCDRRDRLWLTMIDNQPNGAFGTNVYSIDRHDLAAGWTYHGRLYRTLPGNRPGSSFGWQSGPGALDPVTDTIWKCADFASAHGTASIACAAAVAAGARSQVTGPRTAGSRHYDTYIPENMGGGWSDILADRRPRCWVTAHVRGRRLRLMDIEHRPGVFQNRATRGPGRWRDGDGAVYHRPSAALLVYGLELGADLMKLAIGDGDPLRAAYTWSRVAPHPSNRVIPAAGRPDWFRGLYSKFRLIEDMGDGHGALVAACNFEGPAYVYKLPAGGL